MNVPSGYILQHLHIVRKFNNKVEKHKRFMCALIITGLLTTESWLNDTSFMVDNWTAEVMMKKNNE